MRGGIFIPPLILSPSLNQMFAGHFAYMVQQCNNSYNKCYRINLRLPDRLEKLGYYYLQTNNGKYSAHYTQPVTRNSQQLGTVGKETYNHTGYQLICQKSHRRNATAENQTVMQCLLLDQNGSPHNYNR